MIPYGRHDIVADDIAAVVEVLQSDFLTQGPKVPEFEKAICDYTGAAFSVVVNSATSALHIACLALGVGPGDLVWTSPITFVASANCALYCGAEIDFVDVDSETGNMCPVALANKLRNAERLPKVIIPVHLAGHSCDMQAIGDLAKQYAVSVLEDASHAIGGSYQDQKIGACQYSDICVFSFHPVKIITSAEGGVVTTQQSDLAKRMVQLRSHGIVRDHTVMLRPDEGDWYYEQHELGFNYRMTELQAALGVSQMKRLDAFVLKRNELTALYRKQLIGLPFSWVEPLPNTQSARHLQIIRLHDTSARKQIFNDMRAAGIQVHVHYFPVHLQPFYLQKGFQRGDFPSAEHFYEQILSLPLYPGLELDELNLVITQLKLQLSKQ
ncbi:UDP-4-amino-4,6-dideoxy-N-acetyl-beta-L-altrosamine transaminase [Shewanella sp. WE21]|jgi:UDP-4-amino-4,6-dideoxy-N-acetyl-beta-L-altrosamine transaminase|uniref:UDP-4-amino-4, 6-dideoxy-N-acetyl-beta-L-altrosamine transaminase n=1 Tax=Shewanella sp. WE21 TaxID=2029986 RepID=UPI000CF71CFB|nr:UDP-4-amino-4,6-dideoxy-N-acetyl-beta-L-altrosamine transaminase [Shewanella sp. WE21]AVI67115.1 UDP-4-amino-4,6-dideoxy-N-acetyl-beta-L-altrosamine transaminase [Shewanella sp. WE21]